MEAVCCGVPAPFLPNASVSAVMASHPFGGGNAGGRMTEAELREAMAGGVGAFILDGQTERAEHRRGLLRKCAYAAMQLWNDLEREERQRRALA